MTKYEAKKLVKSGKEVKVKNVNFNESFTAIFIKIDNWLLTSNFGGVYSLDDLEIIEIIN